MDQKHCEKCSSYKLVTCQDGFKFQGCHYGEYNGKWTAEIKECPKIGNKEKIYAFIKERSGSELGTIKNHIYTEFTSISKEEIDKVLKQLRKDGKILLCPLIRESTGMFSGRGYCTPNVF